MLGGKQDRFIFGNAFYANRGNGKFEEISDRVGAENYWPWGPSVGDLNADGWQDVFIASSMNFPYRYGINSLLLNNRGEKFLDSEFLLGIEPRKGGRTHTFWFDLDCSTNDAQLLMRWPNAAQDMCKGQYGKFTIMAPLGTRSSVIFDLNQDGALDIVTNEFYSAPQVLVSDLPQKRPINWLKVALTGTVSNRNGLGATVRVVAGGRVFTQWNDGKSGYLSQSVLPLYFGLDDLTKIDRVEVDWPSGRKQVVTAGLSANSTLRVTESARPWCRPLAESVAAGLQTGLPRQPFQSGAHCPAPLGGRRRRTKGCALYAGEPVEPEIRVDSTGTPAEAGHRVDDVN